MREQNAVYGGEMSAHHYFRDFAYCDSGMIPWLLAVSVLSETQQTLSSLVEGMIAKFPCSGEINFKVQDTQVTIQKIFEHFAEQNPVIDKTDGISLDFGNWRLNVRASNTDRPPCVTPLVPPPFRNSTEWPDRKATEPPGDCG